jgi:hypothetical protein
MQIARSGGVGRLLEPHRPISGPSAAGSGACTAWIVRVARRKCLDISADARLFERSPAQWEDLAAPDWVYDRPAAESTYIRWAQPGFGERLSPGDSALRYYVAMLWWPFCVRPQFLYSVDALTETERTALESERYVRWGRPGRCSSRMLAVDAAVPEWLECCRSPGRGGRG